MKSKIRSKAFLSIIFFIGLSSSLFVAMNIRQQHHHVKDLTKQKAEYSQLLAKNLQNQALLHYKSRIVSLSTTKTSIIKAFAERDREKLYRESMRFYRIFKKENPFFHIMHFHLPNNISFLRLHSPDLYGDDLSKVLPIVKAVNTTHKQLSGYEIGKFGLYYRIVQPLFFQGKYVGCLQFGIKHDQLFQLLRKYISPNIALAIKSQNWKKAHLIQDTEAIDMGEYTLLSLGNELFNHAISSFRTEEKAFSFEFKEKTYRFFSNITLPNYQNEEIAKIIIALDITQNLQKSNRVIFQGIFLGLMLLFFTSVVLYFSFDKFLKEILTLNQSLRENNKELVESKSSMENIISSMSDALFVTAPDGNIRKVNQIGCELLELKEEELIDKEIISFFNKPLMAKEKLLHCLNIERAIQSECTFITKKRQIPVILSISPIYDDNAAITGLVYVATDIAQRKHAEQALKNLNDELENRVQERTSELAESNQALKQEIEERKKIEKHFRQTQKMSAIATLAKGFAHDFNNILTGIIGNLQLAKELLSSGTDITPFLDQVLKGSFRASVLIKQINTFTSQTEQERKPLIIQMLVKETSKLLRASIPGNIKIALNITSQDGIILADASQMHQLLMNLYTNAYQAMDTKKDGVLSIALSETKIDVNNKAFHEMLPGNYLRLDISDTGCGIDKKTLEQIFDPYFTTKKTGEGSGLGLSVVHGIVKGHDGYIFVDSTPNVGTTFSIFIPCHTCVNLSNNEKGNDLIHPGKEHILLVEYEKEVLKIIENFLAGFGYQTTSFTDSLVAYDWFKAHHDQIDLVFTEMNMPNMTGVELAQNILELHPEMPILLGTGYLKRSEKAALQKIGIRELIEKPYFKENLARTFHKLFDKSTSCV